MPKLTLELDALRVESFDTAPALTARGTVRGAEAPGLSDNPETCILWSCDGSCVGTCQQTCLETCEGSCGGSCNFSCMDTCVLWSCNGSCVGTCQQTCLESCDPARCEVA